MKDNMEAPGTVTTEVQIEIYLAQRPDPIHAYQAVTFSRDGLPEDVEALTDYVTGIILERLNSKQTLQLIFEDDRHTKVVVQADRLDSISVLAPEDLPEEWYEDE